ncbi:hypothetical protein DSL72_008932 [Monilinia vaccinii-corymbosi]|uniref:Glycan binding protein Y3-like domain-containing protein n=1 Tax=Monilinia vaccinii-corymbosi TaxID=61207 RepID=A0A8A3PQK6_9HELO|nr:hypothetical protein DSL72_008932 [Monilinia vaccinii-corymbosi]
MKLSNLSNSVLTILAFTSSTAYATCYSTGINGSPRLALAQLNSFCSEKLTGNYQAGTGRTPCMTLPSNLVYNFKVYNIHQVTHSLSTEDCVKYLTTEVNCPKGGESTHADIGLRFVVMPNNGVCIGG